MASRSRSSKVSSSPSSDRTVPARPPSSKRFPESCGQAPERSLSRIPTCCRSGLRDARICEWLPVLAERRGQFAGTLSGGQQQMLAIGRGLASSPKLLMLDEPSMGLAPAIADFIFERLIEIRRQSKLTILLVEQRVAEALESADHGYVLEAGRVALEGNNQTLRADDRIRKAYLGM